MNIKKSRIIQIIKEEMRKMTEDDDSGLSPVSLTRTTQAPAPSDELATIEMQIHFLEEKLAELQTRRVDLVGEEPEQPEDRGPVEAPEETQLGDTDYLKKVMGIDR